MVRLLEAQKDRLDHIDDKMDVMKDDLKYHIKRTDILEDLHKDNEKRIVLLEEPKKARQYILGFVIDVSKVLGAITAFFVVWKYIKPLL